MNPVRNLQKKKLAAHGGRITQSAKGGLHYSCNVRRQRLTKLSPKTNDKMNLQWQISNGVKYPNFNEEKKLQKKGYKRIAGLDEAGRGPLAGPVVAAAVIILKNPKSNLKSNIYNLISKIKDSKKLSPKKREEFYKILTKHPAIKWGIGKVSAKVIDKINIKNASELAMEKAVKKLKSKPDFLIIDGKYLKNENLKKRKHKLIVKADEKVFSCSAASIIAKVTRDKIMKKYHRKYPQYGFDKHKGYPTKYHKKTLKKYRPCKIHRKSFKPVKNLR